MQDAPVVLTPSPFPFLRLVGDRERRPLRWLVWLLLTVAMGVGGLSVFGLLLGVLDAEAVTAAAAEGALPDGPTRLVDEVRFTFVVGGALMVLALAVLAAARLAFHRPAWTFIGPVSPFRLRLFALGFLLFGAVVVVGIAVERALRGEPLDPPVLDPAYALNTRLIYLGGSALFLLVAATAEEIVFRGVLLQFNAAFTRNAATLIVINGLVFSAFHFDPSPGAFVARAVSGAVWSWTVLRLSGLEFAIGAHLANNLVLSLLVEPISEGARPGRDYPVGVLVADIVTTLTIVLLLEAALRSPRIRAWAEVDPPRSAEAVFD
jgi:hypothetical protein